MDWLQELSNNQTLYEELCEFLKTYGTAGLRNAMQQYAGQQQTYLCKSRGNVHKVSINEIHYLRIDGHAITIFTADGEFQKYGTLSQEILLLAPYGFIQCSQSCLVSLHKISGINGTEILLLDGTRLHISRNYTRKVLMAYTMHEGLVLK